MLKSASLATVAPVFQKLSVATAIGLAVAIPPPHAATIFHREIIPDRYLACKLRGFFLNRVQREINAQRPVQRTGATEL